MSDAECKKIDADLECMELRRTVAMLRDLVSRAARELDRKILPAKDRHTYAELLRRQLEGTAPSGPTRRLSRTAAAAVIDRRLIAEFDLDYRLIEDGEDGWAFFMQEGDTTSYVHANGDVEWYGTPVEVDVFRPEEQVRDARDDGAYDSYTDRRTKLRAAEAAIDAHEWETARRLIRVLIETPPTVDDPTISHEHARNVEHARDLGKRALANGPPDTIGDPRPRSKKPVVSASVLEPLTPTAAREPVEPQRFYLLDSRSVVGNCASWWGPGGSGYTCEIAKAGTFSLEDAIAERETDIPVPASLVAKHSITHVRLDLLRSHIDIRGYTKLRKGDARRAWVAKQLAPKEASGHEDP